MKTFTITLSEVEVVALSYVMDDPEQWAQNAISERARIAIDEIVASETARMIADKNITTIPATTEEIILTYSPPIINDTLPEEV